MKAYYDARAREYDDWIEGTGVYDGRERPGWHEEVAALRETLAALPAARTLDVAAGSGYFTRFLPGDVTAFDQSENMLAVARERAAANDYVSGDALELPFAAGDFERLFTGHFYGHLGSEERARFLAEARRVAPELVVLDSAWREEVEREEVQERLLRDGSRWQVYKRYFEPEQLAEELGGGRTVFAGRWFVVVSTATG
jgi:demethylmenaquinone methyltransferase/2-methoxy-6-polyprenyl-1,4-benzoquinol methylase